MWADGPVSTGYDPPSSIVVAMVPSKNHFIRDQIALTTCSEPLRMGRPFPAGQCGVRAQLRVPAK